MLIPISDTIYKKKLLFEKTKVNKRYQKAYIYILMIQLIHIEIIPLFTAHHHILLNFKSLCRLVKNLYSRQL